MIVGVFTSWHLPNFFEKPELVFERGLEGNPAFPFELVDTHHYSLKTRSSRFTIGLVCSSLLTVITMAVYGISGQMDEYIIFPLILLGFSLNTTWNGAGQRTYIINTREKFYEFHKGRELIIRGHLHNIYLRVKGLTSGSGQVYYNVILGGYMMEAESLTRWTTKKERLARLTRKLAYRLDLNYFDDVDTSRNHVIRHRCPYSQNATTEC